MLDSVPSDVRLAFMDLPVTRSNVEDPINCRRVHLFPLGEKPVEDGFFEMACRANHACFPNAASRWNDETGTLTTYAVTDIAAGAEISMSYGDGDINFGDDDLEFVADKQAFLLKYYGFKCACLDCIGAANQDIGASGVSDQAFVGVDEARNVLQTPLADIVVQ